MMDDPKVACKSHPGTLTIELPLHTWPCERDFFMLLADAIGEKAESLRPSDAEDAEYLDKIANAIAASVSAADEGEQREIANIFG